jgi:hypothetical protein
MSSPADGKPPPGWSGPERKITDEEWQERMASVREGLAQWKKDHPEEAEAARLKAENARLEYELNQAKVREAEQVRTRQGNRDMTISMAVYFGGGFLIWLLFGGSCPSCAWNGAATASWWDFLAIFAMLGWGIGGIFAGHYVADWLRWHQTRGE